MQHVAFKDVVMSYPGGRARFCKDAGISEGRLSQILGGDRPSPELAIRIHSMTKGAIPGSTTRPDLWREPQDVPVDLPTEAAE